MSDLIERLKDACVGKPHAKIAWPHRLLHDAAAEITRLTSALAASEEARRAERAAVVREAVEGLAPHPRADVKTGAILELAQATVRALATDDDNTALERIVKAARTVKPLEWEGYWAASPYGPYSVWEGFENEDGRWCVAWTGSVVAHAHSFDAAKAAAQADYETRILSALSDTTDKGER